MRELYYLEKENPNILHGDLSPDNLLVISENAVKWIDWENKQTIDSSSCNKNYFRAKVGYLSPERAINGVCSKRSEIFAFGVVVFETITEKKLFCQEYEGHLPCLYYDRGCWEKMIALVPDQFRYVLQVALHPVLEARFQNFREFLLEWEKAIFEMW